VGGVERYLVIFPFFAEITPLWIDGFNQCDFAAAQPTFQLLFSTNCGFDVIPLLVIDQFGDAVFGGEAFDLAVFVFGYPAHEVIGHADIEGFGCVGHDVDVVLAHEDIVSHCLSC